MLAGGEEQGGRANRAAVAKTDRVPLRIDGDRAALDRRTVAGGSGKQQRIEPPAGNTAKADLPSA